MSALLNFIRVRFVSLLLAFGLFQSVAAQSLLTLNLGFENGNTTGWTNGGGSMSADSTIKRTGSYSGRTFNRTQSWNSIVRDLRSSVTVGKTYRYSVWIRLGSRTSNVSLVIAQTDASPRNYRVIRTASVSSTGWTKLSGFFTHTTNGTTTELIAYLDCPAGIDVYMDDSSLELSEAIPANGDFETGSTDGWSGVGATVAINSSEKHTGDFSGYVTGRSDNWHGAWLNDLNSLLTTGKTYRISLWVKPAGNAALKMQLTTKQTNVVNGTPNDVYGPLLQERVCAPGEWSELSGGFKYVNNNTSGLSVYLYCNDDKTSSYYVDDAKITVEEVTVDLATQGSTITQKAAGFLHGLGDTQPSQAYYEPLKPRIERFAAFLGSPTLLGAPAGFSAPGYMNRLKAIGAKQQTILSDEYLWFGYNTSWGWPGDAAHADTSGQMKTSYQILDEKIDALQDYALANFPASSGWQIEWDIWNEPDNGDFWARTQSQFFETWKHAYQRIRAKDPTAVIAGPSIAFFVTPALPPVRGGWLKQFLLYAKDPDGNPLTNDSVLPDIISWHEMGNPKEIPDQVKMIRDFMAANGIPDRPIDVNEYQGPGDSLMLSPGNTVQFLSQFESTDIRHAIRACWDDASGTGNINGLYPGRLDNIMTTSPFLPRAVWHVYNSYAGMSGKKVSVSQGGFLAGFGAADNANGRATLLVGNDGTQEFDTNLTINNLSQLADFTTSGKVRVRVREIPFSGLNALNAPTDILTSIATPINNTLNVPLNVKTRSAYEITLETGVPKVVSITPVNGAGISAVQYRVIFDRAVTGFDSAQDVTITGSGASATHGSIVTESPTSYLLNLSNVTGSGSLAVKVIGVTVNSVDNGLSAVDSSPSPAVFTLQTPFVGSGTVSRSPNSAAYPSGTMVQITPTPAEGYKLGSWSGGASGSANPLSVTISAATSVTANFVTNPGVYSGWSIEKLGSVQSMTADSDADGASNLIEYALAMNPTLPDAFNLPTASIAPDGHLRLTYRRNLQATDLTYVVQGSGGLANWTALVNPTVEDLGTFNNVQTLRATDPNDPGTKRFLRLQVTRS